MAAGVEVDVVAVVVVGVVVDVEVTGVVVGVEELDFLVDLLDFVFGARCVDFCVEGLQIWHLKMAFFALRAVSPAQCRCDQEPQVSHWTIREPSSLVTPHLQLTFELLQLRSSGGQSLSCECSVTSLLAVIGCSSKATGGAVACKGADRRGGVGRGWSAVESEEAVRGSASRGNGTFELFWEQLRVRIRTGEPGRLLGGGCDILYETFCSPYHSRPKKNRSRDSKLYRVPYQSVHVTDPIKCAKRAR